MKAAQVDRSESSFTGGDKKKKEKRRIKGY